MNFKFLNVLNVSLLGITGLLLVVLNIALKPQVVTFNQDAVFKQFVLQMSQKNLTDAALKQKTEQFSQNLNASLAEYADKHHVIIINQKTLLAGKKDISDEVLKILVKKLRVKHEK
jgi:type-F conjugative transfer system protein TrbI